MDWRHNLTSALRQTKEKANWPIRKSHRLALATIALIYLSGICGAVSAACIEGGHDLCVKVPYSADDERILATLAFPDATFMRFAVSSDGKYLYVVTNGLFHAPEMATRVEHAARLTVFDVSAPQRPRQISVLDLGDTGVDQFVLRRDVAFVIRNRDEVLGRDSHFDIIDVKDPFSPRFTSRYEPPHTKFMGVKVSEDGNTVAMFPAFDTGQRSPVFVSVVDRQHPQERDDLSAEEKSFAPQDLTDWVAEPLPPDALPTQTADVLVGKSHTSNTELDIFTTRVPPFDAGRLRKTYTTVAKDYRECVSKTATFLCNIQVDTSRLEFSGIRQLLDTLPPGISPAERIVMLNDYGFWLTNQRGKDALPNAVSALQRVVRLSPSRSVAWLNLADAARLALLSASDDNNKASYWTTATTAYNRYAKLTSKIAPDSVELARFNLPAQRSSAADVCDYIAHAFNAGNGGTISSSRGIVERDGKALEIRVADEPGSCTTQAIRASDDDGKDPLRIAPELQAEEPGERWNFRDLRIVPFNGKSYVLAVVDGEPFRVVAPYRGRICTFKRTYKPRLAEDSAPALCHSFLSRTSVRKIQWSAEHASAVAPALVDDPNVRPSEGYFDATAVADLAGNGRPLNVGHYHVEGGGCGCYSSGVALLDGNTMDDSVANKSLLKLQQLWKANWADGDKWARCLESDVDLVRIDGRAYAEQYSGRYVLEGHPASRSLLELNNGAFERVCRIEQVPTFTAVRSQ